eukprot:CAMPEP_0202872294 /NCGR_PEP_ID=MMETSP1391-20130828/20858_1 /ASSEMBLY_ACC=CAM_ASM_000867 /TAXON_ID=1034604 /ORGANISM="Chlamydomonas leiostraca, Strain SAG 11-49" /LENGTH=133 /DNA_ID=CAMNT_0049553303 /DNA_START=331 /DNA_END=729 /DNA_ORIENTATION=+
MNQGECQTNNNENQGMLAPSTPTTPTTNTTTSHDKPQKVICTSMQYLWIPALSHLIGCSAVPPVPPCCGSAAAARACLLPIPQLIPKCAIRSTMSRAAVVHPHSPASRWQMSTSHPPNHQALMQFESKTVLLR